MTKLRLISREQAAFESALHGQIEAFTRANPEIQIECTFLPIHEHYERMIEGDGCHTGEYDLFLCCTDWIPAAAATGGLTPLGNFIAAAPPQDWPDGWHPSMRALISYGGEQVAMPWHDGPEVLHYRRDLFESEVERESYRRRFNRELRPPATWSEFLDVAAHFTRPEEELWGCCEAAYGDGHNNVYDFVIQLWSRGGVLIGEDGEPGFDSSIGEEALQFYVDLFHRHRVAPTECLKLGSVECGDYYASGHAAMSWNWIGFAATCEMPGSPTAGLNACTAIPAGDGPNGSPVSLNIYWGLTIPSGSQNKATAYEFLRWVARPDMDRLTSMSGANGVRLSTWRDPDVRRQFPYYAVIEDIHAGTRTLPATPEYSPMNEAISRAVNRAVNLEMDCLPSLRLAAEECRAILKSSRR